MLKNLLPPKPAQGLWLLFLLSIPSLILLSFIRLQNFVPVHHLTRDPAAVMDAHMYIGLLSNIGVLFWCSATAICFYSYMLLARPQQEKTRSFFFIAGMITLLLMMDDFFMLHEAVFPKIFGLSEKAIFAVYALLVAGFLAYFHQFIKSNTNYIILAVAFAFMGLSVIIDVVDLSLGDDYDGSIYEDGTKFMGIVGWFTFFSYTAYTKVASKVQASVTAITPTKAIPKPRIQRARLKKHPAVKPTF